MIFILEGRGAKVDQPNLSVQQNTALSSLSVDSRGRRGDLAVVGKGLV